MKILEQELALKRNKLVNYAAQVCSDISTTTFPYLYFSGGLHVQSLENDNHY